MFVIHVTDVTEEYMNSDFVQSTYKAVKYFLSLMKIVNIQSHLVFQWHKFYRGVYSTFIICVRNIITLWKLTTAHEHQSQQAFCEPNEHC